MSKERKSQIIKAAAKRFARHGLNKTTLEEIAGDLRIGKATIYNYFNSKEELFYECLEWDVNLIIVDMQYIFDEPEVPFKGKFIKYFEYKTTILENYKLLYDLILLLLRDNTFEKEAKIYSEMISKETEVLSNAMISAYKKRSKNKIVQFAKLSVKSSWGNVCSYELSKTNEDLFNVKETAKILIESF